MRKPLSLFLALRYLKPKRTFVSIITLISVMGVMLGIAVLILVISVMSGFSGTLREKVLGFAPHVMVMGGETAIADWQEVLSKIEKTPGVVAAAPFVQGPVIVEAHMGGEKPERFAPLIRGIDPELEEKVTNLRQFVSEDRGEFDLSGDSTVLGLEIARMLRVYPGDTVTIYSPGNVGSILEAIREAEKDNEKISSLKSLVMPADVTVNGVFESGRYDYDSQILLLPLHLAQELSGLEDAVHGISVRTTDPDKAELVRDAILEAMPEGVFALTWKEVNRNLFEAIAMERNMMFFLLMFIIIVAAFGIMNTLITVTVQKTREIGIMKALGASTGQIVLVFLGQGMIVGFFGNIAGLALGLTVVQYRNEFKDWLAARLGIEVFPASVYQFSRIPAKVDFGDVGVICVSAFVICSLAALIPAYFAARLDPVKALRQE